MDKEPIAKLIEHHRLDCMRMLHGQCSTRRCLVRGGWTPGDASGYSKATCEALETCRVLETLEAQLGGHALTAKEATANLLRASASEAAREAAEAKAARLEEAAKKFAIYTFEDEDGVCFSTHGRVIANWGSHTNEGIALLKLDAEFRAALEAK